MICTVLFATGLRFASAALPGHFFYNVNILCVFLALVTLQLVVAAAQRRELEDIKRLWCKGNVGFDMTMMRIDTNIDDNDVTAMQIIDQKGDNKDVQ